MVMYFYAEILLIFGCVDERLPVDKAVVDDNNVAIAGTLFVEPVGKRGGTEEALNPVSYFLFENVKRLLVHNLLSLQ